MRLTIEDCERIIRIQMNRPEHSETISKVLSRVMDICWDSNRMGLYNKAQFLYSECNKCK